MRRRRRRGFALIAVLWVIAVLAVLAVEVQVSARLGRDAAYNLRGVTRARWAARAGLARALELLDRRVVANVAGIDLAANGESVLPSFEVDLDGTRVRVVTMDARARIHLNRAGDVELQRFLEALGLATAAADSLADALLDWRDGDGSRRPRGAEAEDYRAARSPSRPGNAPFDAVEELGAVRGMTGDRLRLVTRFATVIGDGRVNVNSASIPVLRSLPGIGLAEAQAIARRRYRAPIRNVFELVESVPPDSRRRLQEGMGALLQRVSFAPRDLEVVVTARPEGGTAVATTRAIVLLGGATSLAVLGVVER